MTTIDSEESLAACLKQSGEEAVFILKHSTRCPISGGALQEVRAFLSEYGGDPPPVYINYVVENRPESNRLAEILGITHASPQLFLVSGETVQWHTSHGGITRRAMAQALPEN